MKSTLVEFNFLQIFIVEIRYLQLDWWVIMIQNCVLANLNEIAGF